jgi:hypothetical protein
VGPCVCGLGSNCCCLSFCRHAPQFNILKRQLPPLTPSGSRSSDLLDEVHIGEGPHENNVLHGHDVVVVTRRGDKIKGRWLGN